MKGDLNFFFIKKKTFSAFIISTLAITQAFPFVKEFQEAKLATNYVFKIMKMEQSPLNKFEMSDEKVAEKNSTKGNTCLYIGKAHRKCSSISSQNLIQLLLQKTR